MQLKVVVVVVVGLLLLVLLKSGKLYLKTHDNDLLPSNLTFSFQHTTSKGTVKASKTFSIKMANH